VKKFGKHLYHRCYISSKADSIKHGPPPDAKGIQNPLQNRKNEVLIMLIIYGPKTDEAAGDG
jgi:hypothetical protein